jgi:hypothetical protein
LQGIFGITRSVAKISRARIGYYTMSETGNDKPFDVVSNTEITTFDRS